MRLLAALLLIAASGSVAATEPRSHLAQAAPGASRAPAAERAAAGRFDATGQVPCARQAGQSMGQCAFGVARDGGGTATVVVRYPDGHRRTIRFERGRAVGDGDAGFAVTKDADLNMIRIGTERYEIPDAVPFGG